MRMFVRGVLLYLLASMGNSMNGNTTGFIYPLIGCFQPIIGMEVKI